ncbi:MAG: hypothetical protein KatS3mg038_2511 [Candidatus Kapaibacterium sp.]|nr:MAG: hypothetical protein KatS3mg038_1180 [Candidatus Kapabacteria bacterium]GIV51990.1 MAG: hypothetical protein KatS3mg038_2511 [Candidatus Kapabacteria bacterium]
MNEREQQEFREASYTILLIMWTMLIYYAC